MADQPAYTWSDFALATAPDPRTLATDRDPVTLHHDGREYQRVGDSGWYMTVCWYAGPDHAVRVRDEPGWHTVRTRVTRGGSVSSHSAPRTEADQDIIEDDVDSFLTEAGIPPRPRGYAWFLAPPSGSALSSLWHLIAENERAIPSRAPRADETATAIESAVHRLYTADPPSPRSR